MIARHSTNTLSAERQAAITSVAALHGVRELWLFGSAAAHGDQAAPNDIDIALLGVPNFNKEALATSLQKEFPGCHTDDADSYKAPASQHLGFQLHFVLADDCGHFENHPILRSIRQGICLWTLHADPPPTVRS